VALIGWKLLAGLLRSKHRAKRPKQRILRPIFRWVAVVGERRRASIEAVERIYVVRRRCDEGFDSSWLLAK
jgi:hypothetical protein